MQRLIVFFASGGGLGYAPVASGTFGTLAGIPLFWAFCKLQRYSPPLYIFSFVVLVAVSCWIAGRAEEIFREHDSGKIVIDEIAGYIAATLFLPFSWFNVLTAFFLFRLLDIVKPFPARYIDREFSGGCGVVLDDIVVGFYANLLTRLILLL